MYNLWNKLKFCRNFLKNFMKYDVGNVNMKIEKVREVFYYV